MLKDAFALPLPAARSWVLWSPPGRADWDGHSLNQDITFIAFIAFIAAACPGPPWLPSHSYWSSGAGWHSGGGMPKKDFPLLTRARGRSSYALYMLLSRSPSYSSSVACSLGPTSTSPYFSGPQSFAAPPIAPSSGPYHYHSVSEDPTDFFNPPG